MKTVVLIESFYGGSHKQLMDLLCEEFRPFVELFTLPAKKWHWRARTSALHFAEIIPSYHSYQVVFTSSVLNLAELVALRPDIGRLHKILYFHENQLLYPVCKQQERDFQYGYNQVLSCLVSDEVIFNSYFNQESFLTSLSSYFNVMPKPRPKELERKIRPKCRVLYYPLLFPDLISTSKNTKECKVEQDCNVSVENEKTTSVITEQLINCSIHEEKILSQNTSNSISESMSVKENYEPLHIVWPHRWEHDKNPSMFFSVLSQLKKENNFKLSVIGESFSEIPDEFNKAKETLKDHIITWGYQKTKEDYISVLLSADVVVSTSEQEFFGVAMLEAVKCGCYPLCPKKLVYPEIYPEEYLYNTANQLFKRLQRFCRYPHLVRKHKLKVDVEKFEWPILQPMYSKLLRINK